MLSWRPVEFPSRAEPRASGLRETTQEIKDSSLNQSKSKKDPNKIWRDGRLEEDDCTLEKGCCLENLKNTAHLVPSRASKSKRREHLCQSCAHICVNIICLFCHIHFTVTSVQRRKIKGKTPNASTTFCQVLIYCYCSCNIRGHTEPCVFAVRSRSLSLPFSRSRFHRCRC